MIKVYDSFSQTLKPLVIDDNKVNIYLCGPTVYNYVHIGNVRGVIVMDVLHRLLIHQKYQVNYVHNITDIDDKIINQAQLLQTTESKLSNKYSVAYLKDLKALNIILPTILPKVSEYIPNIINFIEQLISKGYGYVVNGDVYFKVNKIKDYGLLAHKNIVDLIPNFRVGALQSKIDFADFVLWKSTTEGINWDSPWGKGRPGWHTECVVFIQTIFKGKTINIHGGGIDLKFPHHENERAQFMGYHNQELANIWWHNGHVNIANVKMSKSLNNFILVKDFCQQYDGHVLRYLILNRDHQQPISFNDETIINSVYSIRKYEQLLKQWKYQLFINNIKMSKIHHQQLYNQAIMFLSNNIDTTNTITLVETMFKKINEALVKKDFSKTNQSIFYTLTFTFKILGFNFKLGTYTPEVKAQISLWEKLKSQKDYKAADIIRTQLQDINII